MSGTNTGAARLASLITTASTGYTGGSVENSLSSYYANAAISAGYSINAQANGGSALRAAFTAGDAPLACLAAGFGAAEASDATPAFNSDSIQAAGVAAAAAVAVGATAALTASAALAAAAACQAAETAAFGSNQTATQISATGAAAGAAAAYAVTSGQTSGGSGGTTLVGDTSGEGVVAQVAVTYPNALDLEIANDALSRLSEVSIGSFGDNSRTARFVSRLYPRTRATMFAAADWGFARSRIVLQNVTTGVYPWAYQYKMPANVSKPRYVAAGNPANDERMLPPQPFEEGISADDSMRVIWCDVNPAVLVYTQEVLNNAVWDSPFVAAFTWQLAAELAFPVTGNGALAREIGDIARSAMMGQNPNQPMAVMQQQRGPSTTTAARY